jgi:hypothetical protein
MTLALSLATMFGKTVASKLINGLTSRKGGAQKLEAASAALAQGASAIEALKKAFGDEYLSALNEALGFTGNTRFSYEAGTQSYIRLEVADAMGSTKILREELNINLDRLAVLDTQTVDLKSQFRGLMSVWEERCRKFYGQTHSKDIETTFTTIQRLLKGELKNYRQIYQLLSTTSLGGAGAMLIISGVIIATNTSLGVMSVISMFFVGVPWLTVGALVLPGTLLLVLAAKKTRPADEMSLSIALAYKLLERIDGTTK